MSKKTKAQKHTRRLAATRKPRRRTHRGKGDRPNPIQPGDLAALSSSPADFRFIRGMLHLLCAMEDIGVLPPSIWNRFQPGSFLAPTGIVSVQSPERHQEDNERPTGSPDC